MDVYPSDIASDNSMCLITSYHNSVGKCIENLNLIQYEISIYLAK